MGELIRTGPGFVFQRPAALQEPAAQTRTSGLAGLGKGWYQLRRPYVGARNSPRSQLAVSRDFIGSTRATPRS
jgi:hypothetical protein